MRVPPGWWFLCVLPVWTVRAVTQDVGLDTNAVLSTVMPIQEREDLRDSVKWQGFVAAQEAAAGGDWGRARQFIFKLREFVPDNLMLVEQQARLHQLAGEWKQAETTWYEVLARQPHRLDILPELAWCLMRQERYTEALRPVQVVLDRDPVQVEARWIRALVGLRTANRSDETWTVPDMAWLCQRLGAESRGWVSWLGEDGYRDLTGFVWSGGHWPDLPPQPLSSGDLAERSQRLGRALVDLEQAMALNQWIRAGEALSKAETQGATGPLLASYRAYWQGMTGQPGPALRTLSAVLRGHPDLNVVRKLQGALLLDQQHYGEALEAFDALPGTDVEGVFGRMLARLGQGRMHDAWTLYRDLAHRHRGELLRLLRQDNPLLDSLRARPDFMRPLEDPQLEESTP